MSDDTLGLLGEEINEAFFAECGRLWREHDARLTASLQIWFSDRDAKAFAERNADSEIEYGRQMDDCCDKHLYHLRRPTLHAGDVATPIQADSHSLSGTSQAEPGFTNPPRA